MIKNTSSFKELIENEIDYSRPFFDFFALSMEQKNPFVYWKLIKDRLKQHGFYTEAEETDILSKKNYHDHFYDIPFFIQCNQPEIIKEDDNHIYLKIDKNNYYDLKEVKQIPFFNTKSIETIEDLLEGGQDLTIKNCYDRDILHYAKNSNITKYLLKKNKEEKWFNLFRLDNFGGTYLHTQNNLSSFIEILKSMYQENEELTSLFINGNNKLGQSSSTQYFRLIHSYFESKEVSKDILLEVFSSLRIITIINPDIGNILEEELKKKPFFKNIEKQNNEELSNQLQCDIMEGKALGQLFFKKIDSKKTNKIKKKL